MGEALHRLYGGSGGHMVGENECLQVQLGPAPSGSLVMGWLGCQGDCEAEHVDGVLLPVLSLVC